MADEAAEGFPRLELQSIIGFNGNVPGGLIAHPDQKHVIYPLGSTVIIQSLTTQKQEFLQGHSNNVSCITVNRSGQYLASGQVTHMGFKADILIWDYANREEYARLVLHKAKVEALAFSPNGTYLVSLGGQDDGSVVLWNVAKREAICGSPASTHSSGISLTVKFPNLRDDIFITAGNCTLRVWELDLRNRKIWPIECQLGQLKRIVQCLEVEDDDSFFYGGTSSGDVLKVNLKTKLLNSCAPAKEKFSQGVTSLKLLKTGDILVGSGDGAVSLCKTANFKVIKQVHVEGGVTSISLRGQGHQFFTGTQSSLIFRFNFTEFKDELFTSCHCDAVNDIAFPFGTAELFATCSKNDIRVWHTETNKVLLRITVPNMTCNAIQFMHDGKSIVSAWNDGKIRAFTPESGKLLYILNNAHSMGVSAIAVTSDCKWVISGGGEGQVRVWEVTPRSQRLLESMKEHKSLVSCIKVKSNNRECVTTSSDGTCIIWDLVRFVRNQMVLANTMFKCVNYHPEEFQIITSGSDRKIGYWEVFDGAAIRELEGSLSGSINGMDIAQDGRHFVTGGDEKLLKVWGYNEGEITHIGVGHSGNITGLKICPNSHWIISISADGAILRWKFPHH
ncbi:cilia- and flagella-associated protein 52 [Erpetoichthys calabaricus]|uniref:cilia- and flagella-associated protein 52 n=1 Tax=Erpetoichthys calabaricus TaxID=27687 RepID=UPI0010A095D5|nr:cilia- and flagella-associated protein 52 [Erpetoichthys calabaricus]